MRQNGRLVVIAASSTQAMEWCRLHGLQRHEVLIVGDVNRLRGLRQFEYVALPGWLERRDLVEISDSIRLAEAIRVDDADPTRLL